MNQLKQAQTAESLPFLMLDTDGKTPKTGLSPTVTLSKNAGAFAPAAGAVSEIGSGWYAKAGNATDEGTLGALLLHAEADTGTYIADAAFQVVAFDPRAALATSAQATTLQTAITAITTNTARGRLILPSWLVRPATGSIAYEVDLNIYNLQGQLEAPDAAPTIHARNPGGTSLDSGLGSTTMTLVSTGRYKVTYTVASGDTAQEVLFDATWAVGAVSFAVSDATEVQDAEQTATLTAIKAKTDNLPADPASNTQVNTRLATTSYTAAPTAADVATASAAAILVDPTHKIGTDSTNGVTVGTASLAAIASAAAGAGTGGIAVNHNTGGSDNLRLEIVGRGIDDADVRAYLKSDYDAGNVAAAYIKGQTTTGPVSSTSGRMPNPMFLDAGTYTIAFSKTGTLETVTKEVAVA